MNRYNEQEELKSIVMGFFDSLARASQVAEKKGDKDALLSKEETKKEDR